MLGSVKAQVDFGLGLLQVLVSLIPTKVGFRARDLLPMVDIFCLVILALQVKSMVCPMVIKLLEETRLELNACRVVTGGDSRSCLPNAIFTSVSLLSVQVRFLDAVLTTFCYVRRSSRSRRRLKCSALRASGPPAWSCSRKSLPRRTSGRKWRLCCSYTVRLTIFESHEVSPAFKVSL